MAVEARQVRLAASLFGFANTPSFSSSGSRLSLSRLRARAFQLGLHSLHLGCVGSGGCRRGFGLRRLVCPLGLLCRASLFFRLAAALFLRYTGSLCSCRLRSNTRGLLLGCNPRGFLGSLQLCCQAFTLCFGGLRGGNLSGTLRGFELLPAQPWR